MRSALALQTSEDRPSSRQALSHRAAAAAIQAATILGPNIGKGRSAKDPTVKKLRSGQPVLAPQIGRNQIHISISHVADTVAGFAAAESL